MNLHPHLLAALSLAALLAQPSAQAIELYADDESHLNADILAVYGLFNSRKNYDATPGGSTWREGFIKYGLSGDQGLAGNGSLYGALNWVSAMLCLTALGFLTRATLRYVPFHFQLARHRPDRPGLGGLRVERQILAATLEGGGLGGGTGAPCKQGGRGEAEEQSEVTHGATLPSLAPHVAEFGRLN